MLYLRFYLNYPTCGTVVWLIVFTYWYVIKPISIKGKSFYGIISLASKERTLFQVINQAKLLLFSYPHTYQLESTLYTLYLKRRQPKRYWKGYFFIRTIDYKHSTNHSFTIQVNSSLSFLNP